MSFICTIEDETEAQFFPHGRGAMGMVAIGYDDIDDKSYTVHVSLGVMPGDVFDLSFWINEYDGEVDDNYQLTSGMQTQFINREQRLVILNCICRLTHALVAFHKPDIINVCSSDQDAPEKSHFKFFRVATTIEKIGYKIATYDPYHGQRVWRAERIDHSTVARETN